jgi:NAD(P)-dependent dehydrogenase (short-subunit alcohol dehydrogenase family)
MDKIVAGIPDGRIATPNEVADAIVWLCLPSTTHVNGATIDISGGAI